jgi:hypothetical protein
MPGGKPVGASSGGTGSKVSERGPERAVRLAAGRYLLAGGAAPRPMPSWSSSALVWGRGGQSPPPLVVSARTWGCVPRGSRTTRVVPGSTSSPPGGGSDRRRSPGRPAACRGVSWKGPGGPRRCPSPKEPAPVPHGLGSRTWRRTKPARDQASSSPHRPPRAGDGHRAGCVHPRRHAPAGCGYAAWSEGRRARGGCPGRARNRCPCRPPHNLYVRRWKRSHRCWFGL